RDGNRRAAGRSRRHAGRNRAGDARGSARRARSAAGIRARVDRPGHVKKTRKRQTYGSIVALGTRRLLNLGHLQNAVFSQPIIRTIRGSEWSSAGCVSVTFWTTTVRANAV